MAAVYYLALGLIYLGWRIDKKRGLLANLTGKDRQRLWFVVPALVLFWPVNLALWAALKIERKLK